MTDETRAGRRSEDAPSPDARENAYEAVKSVHLAMATTLEPWESIARGVRALREALDVDRVGLLRFDDPEPNSLRMVWASTKEGVAPIGRDAVFQADEYSRALFEPFLRGPPSPRPLPFDLSSLLERPTLRKLGVRRMLGVALRPEGPHGWLLDAQICDDRAFPPGSEEVLEAVGMRTVLMLSQLWREDELKRERAICRATAELAPVGIFRQQHGTLTFENAAHRTLRIDAGFDPSGGCIAGCEPCIERSHDGPRRRRVTVQLQGESRELEVSCVEVPNTPGGVVGTVVDVTDARATRAHAVELAKMSALASLVAGVAHHFNNLLAGVLGNVYVLEDVEGRSLAERAALADMRESGERAADLVRQLMTFARKGPTSVAERDLTPLVRATVETLDMATPREVRLVSSIPDHEELVALVDAPAVQEIILSLVTNARQALGAMGGEIGVRLFGASASEEERGQAPHGWVVLEVRDEGCGISQDVLPHVFEPFFTTREVGEGMGMGLATVFGSAGRMGGDVKVSSVEGEGTTVTVRLPRIAEPVAHTPPSAHIIPGRGERVLLVDDDETVRGVLERVLDHLGYDAVACESAREARRVFDEGDGAFDLLLADVVMPDEDGYALARDLRGKAPQLPVLLMTSYDPEGLRGLEQVPGEVPRVLEKPVNIQKLAGALARALHAV